MSIATLLLDAGADPSASSASGTGTLLHAVCDKAARAPTEEGSGREGHLSLCYKQAELLLHYGASASAANSSGQAAVDVAVWSGDAKLIRLLLSHGGRSTLSTGEGGSLLHAAAAARRSDVLETALPLLDELGIEIDGPDALGQTALHVAVAAADASLVVPLLRARATLDVTEGGGATALQMAVEARDLRCVSALLQVTIPALSHVGVASMPLGSCASSLGHLSFEASPGRDASGGRERQCDEWGRRAASSPGRRALGFSRYVAHSGIGLSQRG